LDPLTCFFGLVRFRERFQSPLKRIHPLYRSLRIVKAWVIIQSFGRKYSIRTHFFVCDIKYTSTVTCLPLNFVVIDLIVASTAILHLAGVLLLCQHAKYFILWSSYTEIRIVALPSSFTENYSSIKSTVNESTVSVLDFYWFQSFSNISDVHSNHQIKEELIVCSISTPSIKDRIKRSARDFP